MDNDLLEKTRATAAAPVKRVPEVVPESSNGPEAEQPQYRELLVEPRKPALRVKFEKPVQYDGETYTELVFDFDSMTGKDFIRAERDFQRLYKADKNEMPMPELKHLYHDLILAHLANVPYLLIQKLERRYYVPLRTEALKACGSSSEEEKA